MGIVLLLATVLSAAGCIDSSEPEMVSSIEAAAAAIAGAGRVQVDQFEGERTDGWQVAVLTDQPEEVRDAVLAVFDGRGYTIEQHGTMTVVANAIVIDTGSPVAGETHVVTVWVPVSAIGDGGYPPA